MNSYYAWCSAVWRRDCNNRSTPDSPDLGVHMQIRRFRAGEETALFDVFHSAVHLIASRDYSEEQVNAWAPSNVSEVQWVERIQSLNPFVAEIDGRIVGYADLQPSGHIEHFYVSGRHPRRGIGASLMAAIHQEASRASLIELTSDVSKTAQPFFERFGFRLVERRLPKLRGIALPNVRMCKNLG
ncbi:MAG: GNAT family N-acetyltransferase [Lysobacteraceae bacterium]|nr:GNAT family N-acetyltransferase [Xanthomonadaceae bacterium]HRX99439.1 GNAT family N-acetyltransferase [Xanthomonadaceae bacterium]